MSSGVTAQDKSFKSKEQAEETNYVKQKEQAQLAAIRREMDAKNPASNPTDKTSQSTEKDFETGFGGQDELEDRYATTSGEH